MISDILLDMYPWIKSFHIMAVIAWMAGLFYLPRIFVYHSEKASVGSETSEIFKIMEFKLYKFIMNPSMITTWILGLCLVSTPGVIDWSAYWPYIKFICLIGMTAFHVWLGKKCKEFATDENTQPGRYFRLMNEVPTILMMIIVIIVSVKPF